MKTHVANIKKSGRPQKPRTAKKPQLTFVYLANHTKPAHCSANKLALGAGGREFESRHPDRQQSVDFQRQQAEINAFILFIYVPLWSLLI